MAKTNRGSADVRRVATCRNHEKHVTATDIMSASVGGLPEWLFGDKDPQVSSLVEIRTVSGVRGLYATADIPVCSTLITEAEPPLRFL